MTIFPIPFRSVKITILSYVNFLAELRALHIACRCTATFVFVIYRFSETYIRYCRLTDDNGSADVNEKWKKKCILSEQRKKVHRWKNEQEWEKKGNRIYRKSVCSFFFFFVWSNNWLCVDGRYCVGIIRLSYFKGYFILFAAPKSVNFLCLFI